MLDFGADLLSRGKSLRTQSVAVTQPKKTGRVSIASAQNRLQPVSVVKAKEPMPWWAKLTIGGVLVTAGTYAAKAIFRF